MATAPRVDQLAGCTPLSRTNGLLRSFRWHPFSFRGGAARPTTGTPGFLSLEIRGLHPTRPFFTCLDEPSVQIRRRRDIHASAPTHGGNIDFSFAHAHSRTPRELPGRVGKASRNIRTHQFLRVFKHSRVKCHRPRSPALSSLPRVHRSGSRGLTDSVSARVCVSSVAVRR